MCIVDVYPIVYADGFAQEKRFHKRCSDYRNGLPCVSQVFRHPENTLPPSPRSLTPSSHRSGDESSGSGDSSRRRRKAKRSGTTKISIEVNGEPILAQGAPRRRSRERGERVIVVDAPPTPGSPPDTFPLPRTAPSSPTTRTQRRMSTSSGRSQHIIVDETFRNRPRPHVNIVPTPQGHRRTPSSGSQNSSYSHHSRVSSTASDDQEERLKGRFSLKKEGVLERIRLANAEIDNRPPVPMRAPAAESRRSSNSGSSSRESSYRRGRVEMPYGTSIESGSEEEREEAELDARLRHRLDKLNISRRNTVSNGQRSQPPSWPQGMYRMN